MNRQEIYKVITAYLKQYPIARIGVFGSYARNEETKESDIDILVSYTEPVNLFTLVKMHRELEELLLRKVDIVNAKNIHPKMKASIEKDLLILAA